MPSYTTSLRLIQPATGEYSGSWGTQVNNGITALVDTSVAGTASITMTAADYTLSTANGATDEARAMFLVLGGTPGAARNVICPAVSKLYYVTNNTTGGFAQTVKTASGSGISVPNGASMVLRCDGTNVVEALNSLGSIVLNGGTANGVAYLNASKALTTGSALTFDGTNFSTTGTATATKLIPTGGSATGNGMYLPGANTLAWSTNGAQAMTLTSNGDLLLGTTTYSRRLTVAVPNAATLGANDDGVSVVNASNRITLTLTGSTYSYYGIPADTGLVYSVNRLALAADSGTPITFYTSGAERMRLDSSGNLGLGVTPSGTYTLQSQTNYSSGFKGFNLGSLAGGTSQNGYPVIGYNVRLTNTIDSYQYNASDWANAIAFKNGQFQFLSAASGTAGNAITFTQAMTLDASGQLSVGAVLAENSTGVYLLPTGEMRVKDNTENGTSQISIYNTNTTNDSEQFFVAMNVADVDIGNKRTDGGALKLFTNNTERARITSGGDFLVGTTTIPSSSNAGFVIAKDADGTYLRNACTITTTRTHFEFVNGNGTVGTISTNASATAYNTSSDRRLKENIAPAADAGAVIDAIEVIQHDWKVGGHTRFGVIAQDLHTVAPEAVSVGDDGDDIEKTWGVDYSKLVPMLIKEIQSLRQRVSQLEQAA